jgi:DNA mismatch repair protein MutL
MKKINVLPPAIFNLLAAGEVVENPASIVKEAVENSLDAGATEIEITLEDGGFSEIRVTDNGIGCDESQIEKVFLPHATSKITSAKDLEKILTLGFRGEALSSIASVSKVEFVSRTEGAEVATKVALDAGKIINKTKVGTNTGTELIVRNLFYNVPARRKFLKTMKAEENNVTAVVQKLILANPGVRFRYMTDGEVVYHATGAGLLAAIEVIYGREISEKLVEVNVNRGGFTLSGFISKPDFSKKNRTWQTVMINGRAVDGGTVAEAVCDAYSNYLMTGCFPFFVLDLKIDETKVDVNVHPRKLQVRFEDERAVFDFVRAAVTESIDKTFVVSSLERFVPSNDESGVSQVKSAENVLTLLERAGKFELSKEQRKIIETGHQKINPYYERKRIKEAVQEEIKTPEIFDGKILGTVLDTYVLVQSGESLYIVDQHAAHERLLFDELTKQIDAGDVLMQPLLEPVVLTLSPAEMNRVLEISPILNQMGIECEVFGKNSLRITAVPLVVSVRGVDTIITNVLANTRGAAPSKLSEIVREKVITECCRSAIKAGQHLTQAQIGGFLSQFKALKTPLCPHGRPVVVALDRKQIEKMFKRL